MQSYLSTQLKIFSMYFPGHYECLRGPSLYKTESCVSQILANGCIHKQQFKSIIRRVRQ